MASTSSDVRLSAGGTTIGGATGVKKTDVLSLEYVTFRVPYEEMNMKFRNGQKEMEKAAANVAKASAMITALTKDSQAPMPKAQLAMKFDFLLKQVQNAQEVLERVSKEQIEEAEKIKRRAEMLDEELMVNTRTDARTADHLERQRHGRYIVWHLLRCGFVATARKMVQEMGLGELIDIEIFEAIHDVEKGLINDKSTVLALAWIEKHRSKLKRVGSRLEIVIRQLDVVEMIGKGMVMEAILYVKQFMTPIAKTNHSEDLQMTMSAIACPPDESIARFPELHAIDRYERAAEYFIRECYQVYEIHGTTGLSILMQCGIAAFKTPSCHCDESVPPHKVRCFVCRPDIWPIAEPLPYAHVANSRILCSMSNELCNDDDNKPYMFPSGHVFGFKTMEKYLNRGEQYYDPVHKKLINKDEALRLYFL